MTWFRVMLVAAALSASAASTGAAASKRTAAVERLAGEAASAYKAGDYERAIDRLERAYELEPVPTLVYNLAKAYDKWGRPEQALAQYLRFMALPEADGRLRSQAEGRVRALASALPRAGAREGAGAGGAGATGTPARASDPPVAAPPAAAVVNTPVVELPNNPKAPAFLFHLGKAYERLNQPQKAIQHYQRFLKTPGADPALRPQVEARLRALGAAAPVR